MDGQLLIPEFVAAEGLSDIVSAVDIVSGLVTTCFPMIAGNPLLVVFAASGLTAVGIRVWRFIRRAAR